MQNEPMSVEQAAESLLAPQPSEEPPVEETQSEELEADTEETTPDEEVDAEETEEELDAADEAEADDEDGEDVEIEEDVTEDEQPQESHTVKVDGEEKEVTLDDLKRSYSGQEYIIKRMKEVGDKAREAEEIYNNLVRERTQMQQFMQQVQQQGVIQQPQPPSRDLLQTDPIAYMEAEADYKEAAAQYNYQQQQMQALAEHNSQAEQAARGKYLQEQRAYLQQRIPEFADAAKASELQGRIKDAAMQHYNFSEEELMGIVDGRQIEVLNDARLWRELQQSKAQATKKVRKAKPVVKAGSKRKVNPAQKVREQQRKRLKESGSMADAVALIMETKPER